MSAEEVGPTADQHDADETGLPDLHFLRHGTQRVTELLVLLALVIQLGMQHRHLVTEPLLLAVKVPEPCAQQPFTHPARPITEYPVHRQPPFLRRPVVTRALAGPCVQPVGSSTVHPGTDDGWTKTCNDASDDTSVGGLRGR